MSVLKSELFLSRVGRYYWYALILFQLKVPFSDIAIFSRIDFGNFRVGNDTLTLPKFHLYSCQVVFKYSFSRWLLGIIGLFSYSFSLRCSARTLHVFLRVDVGHFRVGIHTLRVCKIDV